MNAHRGHFVAVLHLLSDQALVLRATVFLVVYIVHMPGVSEVQRTVVRINRNAWPNASHRLLPEQRVTLPG